MPGWADPTSPVHALPLDALRVLVGILALAYFARTYREAPLFSAPDGLVDHALVRRVFPYARLSLFPGTAGLTLLRACYLAGCAGSVLLAAGVAAQPVALALYVLAVCTYRWNLLVMYVDDAVMHLVLFWMAVLPIGSTLTLTGLDAAASWSSTLVPGFGIRCFLLNLALVYVVAGLWKWASPMWRNGSAVQAALRMNVSYAPDRWGRPWRLPLRLATWFSMAVEPALALLAILPAQHAAKLPLLAGAALFHGGIVATLRFPFANLAMLGAGVLYLGPELMAAAGAPPAETLAAALPAETLAAALPAPVLTPLDTLAAGVVACLALLFLLNALVFTAGATSAPWAVRPARIPRLNPFYVPLWIVGLAQSYRLFDWIDERNYRVEYEVTVRRPGQEPEAVDGRRLFPRSMRHILLQSYLFGNLWVRVDPAALTELRTQVLARYARWWARRFPIPAEIEVTAVVGRLTPDNLDLHRVTRTRLMTFAIEAAEGAEAEPADACGVADVRRVAIVPPPAPRITHLGLVPPEYA